MHRTHEDTSNSSARTHHTVPHYPRGDRPSNKLNLPSLSKQMTLSFVPKATNSLFLQPLKFLFEWLWHWIWSDMKSLLEFPLDWATWWRLQQQLRSQQLHQRWKPHGLSKNLQLQSVAQTCKALLNICFSPWDLLLVSSQFPQLFSPHKLHDWSVQTINFSYSRHPSSQKCHSVRNATCRPHCHNATVVHSEKEVPQHQGSWHGLARIAGWP